MAVSTIRKIPDMSFNKLYTATDEKNFLNQVMVDALTFGVGNYVLSATWQYHYAATVVASVSTPTRVVVLAVPQQANNNYIYVAESNNGTQTHKRITSSAF